MKTYLIASLLVASSLSFTSCSNSPNARTGTVIGALGGAGLGGIIGNQSGRGLEGAAIGAGLGAVAGNVIGGTHDGGYSRDLGYRNRTYGYNNRPYGYDNRYYGYNDRSYRGVPRGYRY